MERQRRVCKECNSGEVEGVCHWMLCMQEMQKLRSGRCLSLDVVLPCMGYLEAAHGGRSQPV